MIYAQIDNKRIKQFKELVTNIDKNAFILFIKKSLSQYFTKTLTIFKIPCYNLKNIRNQNNMEKSHATDSRQNGL